MARFSANLGYLWLEHELCDAIRAASIAGFDAVECHFPYQVPTADVCTALSDTQLPMLSINTRPGDLSKNEFGLAAVPNRQSQARDYIDEAISYAAQIQSRSVHVLAGKTENDDHARRTYIDNLTYACTQGRKLGITILIEPINTRDIPGYFLHSIDAAVDIVQQLGQGNLKILFDCYHVQTMQGDIVNRLKSCIQYIGHIQISSVPDRAEPDTGELNYSFIINQLEKMGYQGYLGAEYRPSGPMAQHLGWLQTLQSRS